MKQATNDLSAAEFVAFDLETTGLHPVACQIVEIGAVRFRGDGTVLGEFQQLINPRCEIPLRVTRIHGISNEVVADQPTIGEVLPRFTAFLGERPLIMLAHNAGFDVGFLATAFSRLRHAMPSHPVIDSCALARRRLSLPNYKLPTIGRHLRLIERAKHRALADAVLLKDILLHVLNMRPRIRTAGALFELVPPISFDSFASVSDDPLAGYEDLWEAIRQEQPLVIKYGGGSQPGSNRTVTPRAVMHLRGQIYLSAYCHRSDCEKTYRLDRISSYRRISLR